MNKDAEKDKAGRIYATLARTTQMDMNGVDKHGLARYAVEASVKNMERGLVLPLFWYLALGLPGSFFASLCAGLFWLYGRDGNADGFAKPVETILRIIALPSSLISAFTAWLATLLAPGCSFFKATKSLFVFDKTRPSYLQGGILLLMVCASMHFTVGGAGKDSHGMSLKRPWIGMPGGSAKLTSDHLRVLQYFLFIATLILMLAIMALVLLVK